jgi:AraC-like DNA-binding protein
MRRVEEWIDAHLFEPITLGRLCDAAGLEVSALHKAFKRHHSVSPMRWVHSRRMVAARLRLMEAGPKDTVIRIAHDCGLVHAGRFSLAYRRRYGEYPSYTLELAIKSG